MKLKSSMLVAAVWLPRAVKFLTLAPFAPLKRYARLDANAIRQQAFVERYLGMWRVEPLANELDAQIRLLLAAGALEFSTNEELAACAVKLAGGGVVIQREIFVGEEVDWMGFLRFLAQGIWSHQHRMPTNYLSGQAITMTTSPALEYWDFKHGGRLYRRPSDGTYYRSCRVDANGNEYAPEVEPG